MIFTYTLILKLIFLIFFLLITLFLIYHEIQFNEFLEKQNPAAFSSKASPCEAGDLKLSSPAKIFKLLKDTVFIVIPAGITYGTFIKNNNESKEWSKKLEGVRKEILNIKAENKEAAEKTVLAKNTAISYIDKFKQANNNIKDSYTRLNNLKSQKESLNNLAQKNNEGKPLNLEEQRKITELAKIDKEILDQEEDLKQNFANLNSIAKEIEMDKNIKNSGISLSDFNLQEFLSSLSQEELLAFSGLLLNGLILNYTINIIIVLYGDFLIKRFDLENKFPKLAKFIILRKKIQSYYLKLCFAWIFIGLLPQIYMYITILGPKLFLMFNL